MTGTKADIAPWLNNPASGPSVHGRDFNQLCVALVFQLAAHFGSVSSSYGDANAAFNAAHIDGTNADTAPAGAVLYYSGGAHGDVAVAMGDGTGLHASSHFTAAEMIAPGSHVGFLTDAQYRARSGYKFRGWSYHFGKTGLTGIVGAPGLVGTQRLVKAGGVQRRVSPTSESQSVGINPAGTVLDLTGFVHGQDVSGNDVWFIGTDGIYFWSGATTDPSTHDLTDRTPATPTPPPVIVPPVVVPPVITTPEPPVVLPPVTTPPEPQEPPVTTTPPADPTTPTTPAAPIQRELTPVELAAYRAGLEAGAAQLATVSDANIPTALSGLLAAHPTGRKRAYYGYAGLALVLSFSGDVITAGILTSQQVPVFVAGVTLATSILLKVGVALGFVAASNTSSK